MFMIIRIAIGLLLIIIGFLIVRNLKLNHKKVICLIVTISSVILTVALAFVPFENVFVTFSSPQEAYDYISFGDKDIKLRVEGDTSDLIVGDKNGKEELLILPKNSDGWKIDTGKSIENISQKIHDGITVNVFRYKQTSECYVMIFNSNGGELELKDNLNSVFVNTKEYNSAIEKDYYTYYAYLAEYNSDYELTLNGETVRLAG